MQASTGKELIDQVMRHQVAQRVPWVPYAGVHAGRLKQYAADEVLQDPDKLFQSLLEAERQYHPDGIPICFDLQLEAEILGCELLWAKNSPPSVVSHPLAGTNEIPSRLIDKEEGRLPQVLNVADRLKKEVGDRVALYGLLCGPFTLASHLRGTELFMDMVRFPDYVERLMTWCAELSIGIAEMYMDVGMDVVAPVDPLVSQISPKHFQQYCSEPYKRIFNRIRERGVWSSFFVCGNAIKNIEVMCQTGPDAISVDENVAMVKAKEITDRYNIVIGGNIPISTTMLFGDPQENRKYVLDLLNQLDHKNLIISPGCDLPYDVPVANVIACSDAVHGTMELENDAGTE